MDVVHCPNERANVSDRVHPGAILNDYQEIVRRYKWKINSRPLTEIEKFSKEQMMEMIGTKTPKLFAEVEEAMDISQLDIVGEVQPTQVNTPNWYPQGLMYPKFSARPVPEVAALHLRTAAMQKRHLELVDKKKNREARNRKYARLRTLRDDNDNWYIAYPQQAKVNPLMTDRLNLYCVKIYRPFKHLKSENSKQINFSITQEIWLLGSNTLADLKDTIKCPADISIVSKQQVDTVQKAAVRAEDVYKSSFIYIDGCFYNDMRDDDNIDLSQVIRDWAKTGNRELGPFTTAKMEETKMDDLKFRLGMAYNYTHQGNHEHVLVIHDVRLLAHDDPQTPGSYPYVRNVGNFTSRYCKICQREAAKWVTVNNERVPETPYFFCSFCYKQYNFVNGQRVGNFQEHRYFDINTV